MKSLLVLCFLASVTASAAIQTQKISRVQLRINYQACSDQVDGWQRNWGRYVVSYDRNEANTICREMGNQSVRMASCSIEGSRLAAGFYCQETSGGGFN